VIFAAVSLINKHDIDELSHARRQCPRWQWWHSRGQDRLLRNWRHGGRSNGQAISWSSRDRLQFLGCDWSFLWTNVSQQVGRVPL